MIDSDRQYATRHAVRPHQRERKRDALGRAEVSEIERILEHPLAAAPEEAIDKPVHAVVAAQRDATADGTGSRSS